jgi:CheY-like chemotaxis protein
MTAITTYRTTAQGAAEVAAKPGKLKPGLKGLLAAVGEKAFAESLRIKFPRAGDLEFAFAQLARDGYVEPLPATPPKAAPQPAVAAAPAGSLENLFNEKPKEPTIHQLKMAEGTISGARRLKAGYQISIVNRPQRPLLLPRGGAGQKHVVLVIDGHEAEALETAPGMMLGGFEVRGAGTKTEIVAALGKQPLPDLIIMDVDLPDAGGLDLPGKFREHDELKDTPIIVVTARAERDDIVAALAYGATGYLNKPIKAETLLRHVKDALGIP